MTTKNTPGLPSLGAEGISLARLVVLGLATLSFVTAAAGQLRLSEQASAAFIKADGGYSQYAVNRGRATFAWRLDLFADAAINGNIFFLSNLRMLQDQIIHVDLFAIKFADLASTGLNLEAGEIELPFGNLGERRFPKSNPFYGLPLTHEHVTTLRSSDYSLWPSTSYYAIAGDGVRILDQGLYDLGVKLYGGAGMFDFWIALMNGMVSATSTYSTGYGSSGLNTNSRLGMIGRLAMTPLTGVTLGGSYATGPFLKEGGAYSPGGGVDPSEIDQHIVEADLDFSLEHAALYAEVFYNVWTFKEAIGSDLNAFGYSLEGRYTLLPRFLIALRAGGLRFNDVSVDTYNGGYFIQHYEGPWDHDVFRLEGALGYRLDRSALLKIVYEWNRTFRVPEDPADNVLVMQAVVGF